MGQNMKLEPNQLQELWPSQGFVDAWRCPELARLITWGGNPDTLVVDLLKQTTENLWTAAYLIPQNSTQNLLEAVCAQVYEEGDVQSPDQLEQACVVCVWSHPNCQWNLVAVISNIPTNLDDDLLDGVCLLSTGEEQTTAELVDGLGWYVNDTALENTITMSNEDLFAAMDLIASLSVVHQPTADQWNTWGSDPAFGFAFNGLFVPAINRYPGVCVAPVKIPNPFLTPREGILKRIVNLFKKDKS